MRRKTAATVTTEAPENRGKGGKEDLPVRNSNNGAGENYHVGEKFQEEKADISAKWDGEKTKGSATEEEAETMRGVMEFGQALMAWESEESGVEEVPGGAVASGGDTCELTSMDADAAGAGGHHGAGENGKGEGCWPAGKPGR